MILSEPSPGQDIPGQDISLNGHYLALKGCSRPREKPTLLMGTWEGDLRSKALHDGK
jgi:hypothetical protein